MKKKALEARDGICWMSNRENTLLLADIFDFDVPEHTNGLEWSFHTRKDDVINEEHLFVVLTNNDEAACFAVFRYRSTPKNLFAQIQMLKENPQAVGWIMKDPKGSKILPFLETLYETITAGTPGQILGCSSLGVN